MANENIVDKEIEKIRNNFCWEQVKTSLNEVVESERNRILEGIEKLEEESRMKNPIKEVTLEDIKNLINKK